MLGLLSKRIEKRAYKHSVLLSVVCKALLTFSSIQSREEMQQEPFNSSRPTQGQNWWDVLFNITFVFCLFRIMILLEWKRLYHPMVLSQKQAWGKAVDLWDRSMVLSTGMKYHVIEGEKRMNAHFIEKEKCHFYCHVYSRWFLLLIQLTARFPRHLGPRRAEPLWVPAKAEDGPSGFPCTRQHMRGGPHASSALMQETQSPPAWLAHQS